MMRRVVGCWTVAVMMLAGVGFEGIGCGTLLARTLQVSSADLGIVQVRPDFYLIAGAGGNIAVQAGPAGVILVDDTLTTYTTHMKARMIRRNGAPVSDQATMTMHVVRHHSRIDKMMDKLAALKLRKPGEPHPFVNKELR